MACNVWCASLWAGFGFSSRSSPSSVRSILKPTRLLCRSLYVDDEDYLLDAPVSVGDGFSFVGGKYSNEEGPAEKWFARGKMVNACAVEEMSKKAQDPIFGLAMGEASQISDDYLRWFCVEEGDDQRPSVLLVHGFPSQSYSYRKVIPILSTDFHVVAFDWLGFGFSDKPQVNFGFNYTMEEYINALECLVQSLGLQRMSIVAQPVKFLAGICCTSSAGICKEK
eukprot:c14002_g1_i2 orf=72-743(+)